MTQQKQQHTSTTAATATTITITTAPWLRSEATSTDIAVIGVLLAPARKSWLKQMFVVLRVPCQDYIQLWYSP